MFASCSCSHPNDTGKRVYPCDVAVVYIQWSQTDTLVRLQIRTGARPGVNNSFEVFNKELNGRNFLWLTCLGRRGRELCAECTISCFSPVAVVTGAQRGVNVCSPRLTAEERETFREVGGLMSVTTDSAHAKLYLDLSAQHTNMWYFYKPNSQNKPASELPPKRSDVYSKRNVRSKTFCW